MAKVEAENRPPPDLPIPNGESDDPIPRRMRAKSFAKEVEDQKKEAAPAPDILNRKPKGIGGYNPAAPPPNPFETHRLVMTQEYLNAGSTTKVITPGSVKVCKPSRQDFFRIHPGPEYRQAYGVLENKGDREFYVVDADMGALLHGEYNMCALYTGITKAGGLFVYPVRLPDEYGKQLDWHRSAMSACELAITKWVRIAANMDIGTNEVFLANSEFPDPDWPDLSPLEILNLAFHGEEGIISSPDHPMVKKLRGQI